MVDESGLGFISAIEALSTFYHAHAPEMASFVSSHASLYDTISVLAAMKALALDEYPPSIATESCGERLHAQSSGSKAEQLLHDFSSITVGLAKANSL